MWKPAAGLYPFCLLVVIATFILIGAGGLVTSHDAGLSVPDWPLSYGQFFPPMSGLMVWEHSHRVIAGGVGMLSLILTLWITFRDGRKWFIGVAWLTFGLVILQALLGGLTVLMELPPLVSISHALIGQIFFGLCLGLAFCMSPYYARNLSNTDSRDKKLTAFCGWGILLLLIQLVAGGVVRHTHKATTEHIVMALVVTLYLLHVFTYALLHHSAQKKIKKTGTVMAIVLVVQVFLGIGAFAFKEFALRGATASQGEIIFTALHQTVGALLLGSLVLLWLFGRYPSKGMTESS